MLMPARMSITCKYSLSIDILLIQFILIRGGSKMFLITNPFTFFSQLLGKEEQIERELVKNLMPVLLLLRTQLLEILEKEPLDGIVDLYKFAMIVRNSDSFICTADHLNSEGVSQDNEMLVLLAAIVSHVNALDSSITIRSIAQYPEMVTAETLSIGGLPDLPDFFRYSVAQWKEFKSDRSCRWGSSLTKGSRYDLANKYVAEVLSRHIGPLIKNIQLLRERL